MKPIFITGIGTGIGKTLVAAILAEALEADYWKPVQAGFQTGTDSGWVRDHLTNPRSRIHPEKYVLQLAASPHIAAREEGLRIDLDLIAAEFERIRNPEGVAGSKIEGTVPLQRPRISENLVIEGAGGLLVPLNEREFVIDLIRKLKARVVLVSRNYLGSINHSLMTARICREAGLEVIGWVFNDQYMSYENEIAQWTGLPAIASIPFQENPGKEFVREQAAKLAFTLRDRL